MAPESGLTGDIFKCLWHSLPSPVGRVVTSIKMTVIYIKVMENNHIREVRERKDSETQA